MRPSPFVYKRPLSMMTQSKVVPFRITIADARLQRLHQKLALTDLPDELESDSRSPWSRGPPLQEIRQLLDYWRTKYDWRKAEASLNSQVPHFMTTVPVDGFGDYNVHFVHLKSQVKNAIPLLFLHGWPGNFMEVLKIAPLLTNGDGVNEPAFHVIAPSLIDHGFSSGSRVANFYIDQHAEVYHKVMLTLGYNQYVAQGGDTGYLLCRMLGQMYPDHCRAHHINMVAPLKPTASTHPEIFKRWHEQGEYEGLSLPEKVQLERTRDFVKEGKGYFAIHSTRPMALAYSMADSPIGLLAWIYDKLTLWSDSYAWTPDEILTWVSIYYFSTAGPASSFNTYYSNQHRAPRDAFDQARQYTNNPVGISRFPKDISNAPKLWNLTLGPVVFEAEHERGGHFAAFEVPELLVQDLRKMFGRGGGAFGVIQNANGFAGAQGGHKGLKSHI